MKFNWTNFQLLYSTQPWFYCSFEVFGPLQYSIPRLAASLFWKCITAQLLHFILQSWHGWAQSLHHRARWNYRRHRGHAFHRSLSTVSIPRRKGELLLGSCVLGATAQCYRWFSKCPDFVYSLVSLVIEDMANLIKNLSRWTFQSL